MSKLSKREKLLLYILLIVLLIMAGWFLIKPAMEEAQELESSIEAAETEKSYVEQIIATRPTYAAAIDESEALVKELQNGFLPSMTNDDLDRYITGLLQKNGLLAESLLISASADEAASLAVTKLGVKVNATGELAQFVALVQQVSELQGIRISGVTVRESGEKTVTVPLSDEEIAELTADGGAADDKPLTREVSVTEYDIAVEFEVIEFDAALFAAMAG